MRSAIITLLSLIATAFAASTGDYLGQCNDLNVETCYGDGGFTICSNRGLVYQACAVGLICTQEGSAVNCL